MAYDIVYLGRARLQRSRANLIQMLQTAAAFKALGSGIKVFIPPWRGRLRLPEALADLGVDPALEVIGSPLLHPRWDFWPFVFFHRRLLKETSVIYTRVADISRALAASGLAHHLEVHDVDTLTNKRTLARVVGHHRRGVIRTLIPISHAAADRLVAAGADRARIHVAHSGVKLEAFAHVSPFDPATLERPRIVHLGKLSAPRGLNIFRHLAVQGSCAITIVSGDTIDLPNAVSLPAVPPAKVPEWYSKSDVVLLPYQPNVETAASMSPVKMFEAMAAGRPIIASNLATIREVLTHEQTALLVEPGDLDAWERALNRLRAERGLAISLAQNARAEAAKYSWICRAQGILRAIENHW
ncbi:MAG TPA: glycosyltransferase [Burkholderiales bacterium]|nr:glycosyltransferase [Burkholderiales bacterium]